MMITNVAGDRVFQQLKDKLDEAYSDIHSSGNWIDNKYTHSAQEKLKKITKRKHARLVTTGTTAIQTALLAWNMIGKRVACVNYSYVASVNQAALLNRVELYDVDEQGLINIDEHFDQDAVIPVSLYGNTIDYDRLDKKENTKVIVDCAQSLGATYKGEPDGSFGDVAVFSFARNKPVPTAGTHGALVWDDDTMTDKVNAACINGKLGRNSPITSMGVNGTPFEIQAAWIDAGLDHMHEWQSRRKNIHHHYKESFTELPVSIIEPSEKCVSNYHKFAMKVENRDDLHQFLQANNIQALLHYTDNFADFFGSNKDFPNTKKMCESIITLPNHAWMTDSEVETVAEKVQEFYK